MTRATLKNKAKKISPAFAEAFEIMKNPEKFEKEHLDIDIDDYLDSLSDRIEEELEDTELEEYIDEIFDLIS